MLLCGIHCGLRAGSHISSSNSYIKEAETKSDSKRICIEEGVHPCTAAPIVKAPGIDAWEILGVERVAICLWSYFVGRVLKNGKIHQGSSSVRFGFYFSVEIRGPTQKEVSRIM